MKIDPTLTLAFYGAFISTILAIREIVLAITEYTNRKRQVKLDFIIGYGTHKGNKDIWFCEVSATNIGTRPIIITEIGFYTKTSTGGLVFYSNHENIFNNKKLPIKLEDGDNLTTSFYLDESWKGFMNCLDKPKSTRAFVLDTENKYHTIRIDKTGREKLYGVLRKSISEHEK